MEARERHLLPGTATTTAPRPAFRDGARLASLGLVFDLFLFLAVVSQVRLAWQSALLPSPAWEPSVRTCQRRIIDSKFLCPWVLGALDVSETRLPHVPALQRSDGHLSAHNEAGGNARGANCRQGAQV